MPNILHIHLWHYVRQLWVIFKKRFDYLPIFLPCIRSCCRVARWFIFLIWRILSSILISSVDAITYLHIENRAILNEILSLCSHVYVVSGLNCRSPFSYLRVLHWIETTVHFFSYNSFSSSTVSESICSLFLTTAFLSINQTHTFLQDVFSCLNYNIYRRKNYDKKKDVNLFYLQCDE